MKAYQLHYMNGFGNYFESEIEAGILPRGQNSPQQVARGLFAEQLSGSSFTAIGRENQRSWLYKKIPTVCHSPFKLTDFPHFLSAPLDRSAITPQQLRWSAFKGAKSKQHFLEGIFTYCAAGNTSDQQGIGVHLYSMNDRMDEVAFCNADGDFLILPQEGPIEVVTEFGRLSVEPLEIIVIGRGMKFQVHPMQKSARGYVCENYGAHFSLPYRSVIGASGLANERDFQTPVAWHSGASHKFRLIQKFAGRFFETTLPRCPFDVLAWHGNYVPYKYDLTKFNTINTVSFDHPDPSIFTVLTSPSFRPGVANCDFAIFPPRWMVAENTFRPPYFHRNIMSEFMGLITGVYDAKPDPSGFVPGGASLHNCMSAHGPDTDAYLGAIQANDQPVRLQDTMAFMFETSLVLVPALQALKRPELQKEYWQCWQGLAKIKRT